MFSELPAHQEALNRAFRCTESDLRLPASSFVWSTTHHLDRMAPRPLRNNEWSACAIGYALSILGKSRLCFRNKEKYRIGWMEPGRHAECQSANSE